MEYPNGYSISYVQKTTFEIQYFKNVSRETLKNLNFCETNIAQKIINVSRETYSNAKKLVL
mgnify:CR=1 FL=1